MNITLRAQADARLAEPGDSLRHGATDFSAQVNRMIAPRRHLGPGEIHVKAIYLISDRRNAFGGKVPADELERLRALCINVPVLVGHQKQSLPIGRTFRAELVRDTDQVWLKVWFYWLRDRERGDRLRSEIEGGIVSEASISFSFDTPECEKCGKDFRFCPHDGDREGSEGFLYRDINRVLEVSLVYRGAVSGTRIVDASEGGPEYDGTKVFEPAAGDAASDPAPSTALTPGFKLWCPPHEDAVTYLSVCDGRMWRHWLIPQFSMPHLQRGARFIAQPLRQPPVCARLTADDSGLAKLHINERGHLLLECAGQILSGHFVIRPTRLNHNGSQIIYRSHALSTESSEPQLIPDEEYAYDQ